MADSCWCMTENHKILKSNYPSIKKKKWQKNPHYYMKYSANHLNIKIIYNVSWSILETPTSKEGISSLQRSKTKFYNLVCQNYIRFQSSPILVRWLACSKILDHESLTLSSWIEVRRSASQMRNITFFPIFTNLKLILYITFNFDCR